MKTQEEKEVIEAMKTLKDYCLYRDCPDCIMSEICNDEGLGLPNYWDISNDWI